MSYDLGVYLSTSTFPETQWVGILASIGQTEEGSTDRFGRHWTTTLDRSCVFTSVCELTSSRFAGFERGYRWQIGVCANTGCTARARWAQFAIPSRCIQRLPGAVAFDPQSGAYFDTAGAFHDFATEVVPRWRHLPQELRDLGLLSTDWVLRL